MNITINLTPGELMKAVQDGTLAHFMKSVEAATESQATQALGELRGAVQGITPSVQAPVQQFAPTVGAITPAATIAPTFNPMAIPGATGSPAGVAGFDPMAIPGVGGFAPVQQGFDPMAIPGVQQPAGFAAAPAFDPMAIPGVQPAAPAQQPAAQIAPPPISGAPGPTIDEVRAKIAPILKAGKGPELTALFGLYGCDKLTDVNPGHFADLIARAALIK